MSLGIKNLRIQAGLLVFFLLIFLQIPPDSRAVQSEAVILLHGLAKTDRSMKKLGKHLTGKGYYVVNVDYPSRSKTIQQIAEDIIPGAIAACNENGEKTIHFVTHSMGGIIIRYYLRHHDIPRLGRVVMLSPPNKGSEVVDKMQGNFVFNKVGGPAGQQLGTGEDSLPCKLGNVDFPLGIITGDRTVNPVLSMMIPGSDDGKVSVDSARVGGMTDFIVVHSSHPFIMRNREVIRQTTAFLNTGRFMRETDPAE